MSVANLSYRQGFDNFCIDVQLFFSHGINSVVNFFTCSSGEYINTQSLRDKKWVVNPEGQETTRSVAAERFDHVEVNEEEECPVCLELLKDRRVNQLDCDHKLCHECLVSHINSVREYNRDFFQNMGTEREINCPMCRDPISRERVTRITGNAPTPTSEGIDWELVGVILDISLRICIAYLEESRRNR